MKKIKVLMLAICAAALSLVASGCGGKIKEWTCDHDYGAQGEIVKVATCTEEGEGIYTCRKCDKTKRQTIAKIEHDYSAGVRVKEPSCTEKGLVVYTCQSCQGEMEEEIEMLAHRAQSVAMVAPTCTTSGTTAYSYCLDCNGFVTPRQEIPAYGHTPVTMKGVAATCTTSGLTSGSKCSDCGEVLAAQEVIDPKGHIVVTDKAQLPTCRLDGLSAGSHCSACGEIFKAQEVLSALGHDYGEDNLCDLCGEHRHTEVVDIAIPASCTNSGLTEGKHCSECLVVLVPQEPIPAFGHDMGEGGTCLTCGAEHTHVVVAIPAVTATCSTVGWSAGSKCIDCGKIILAPQEIAKVAHEPMVVPAVEPTCTATGLTEGSICEDCGELLVAQAVVPVAPHNYDANKVCVDCGYVYYTMGLAYDSAGRITSIGSASDTTLYIPGIYNGYTVSVAAGAFANNTKITKVVFRGDVTLEAKAFYGCTALQTVVFNGDVTFLPESESFSETGDYMQFYGCTGLKEVVHKYAVFVDGYHENDVWHGGKYCDVNIYKDCIGETVGGTNIVFYMDGISEAYENAIGSSTVRPVSAYEG